MPPIPSCSVLAYLSLDYFSPWTALGLFAGLGALVVFLGMRSMAGLGPARKWTAIVLRLCVLLLIILILGDVKWIRQNTDVEVMVVRDISRSTALVHDYPGQYLQTSIDDFLTSASAKSSASHQQGDRIGQISFNERPFIDVIPRDRLDFEARPIRSPGTGTDAAAAIQLALASMDNDAMHRIVLIWDGNATAGDLNTALAAAASQHVPVDVMPLDYNVSHEVLMDKFIAPTWRQEGQPGSLEVHVYSTNASDVHGNLSVTNNGLLIPLPNGLTTEPITLHPGKNVERVPIPPQTAGVHEWHAIVDGVSNISVNGVQQPGASQLDNKSADAFTFVKGTGQVLLVDNIDPSHQTDAGRFLRDALGTQRINVVSITPEEFPNDSVALQGYDAIILANVPRGMGGLSDTQEHILASYVHDQGGGLVMIGGSEAYGAGGWQGSRLEQELPVVMEIPAQRQIPKGALVLCMDPAEAPDGNYWGEQCAIKACEALSSQDEIGLISYSFSSGGKCAWDAPLAPKRDGSKVIAAIKNWELGDLPSFEEAVRLAVEGGDKPGLLASDAKNKHIVIITDDDPSLPGPETIKLCQQNRISISTITIYPHQPNNIAPGIVELAKATGGRSYGPIENNPSQLPQIFIKEATVVKRSIIQEDSHGFAVTLNPSNSQLVKGIPPGPLPRVYGMDLTARKNNPLIEVPVVAGPKADPLLADWQAGLGKVAVYTSDAYNKWDVNWVASPLFAKFWSQVVRSVSRSPMSSDFEVDMTTDGDKGHITVQALNEANAFNNFLNIDGTLAVGNELAARHVRLQQTGPGTYEADFDASEQGSYICYLNYTDQTGKGGSLPLSGTVVNSSPELRVLRSNDSLLQQIAQRTGGRMITPFDPASADLFSRDGLTITNSPHSIGDLLLQVLLVLILLDVAVRRIAWDWLATKRVAAAAAKRVREFTQTYRKIEQPTTIDSLRNVRGKKAAAAKARPNLADASVRAGAPVAGTPATSRPDPRAKFDAGAGVEGDISTLVGGAADKPIPKAPEKQPKGLSGPGGHTGGLLEAKRRAQQKIKQKEESE